MNNLEVLLIVYFVYGLSFFCMGLILILESARTSSPELVRLLRPLAIFGLLHGFHEWLEIYAIETARFYDKLPVWLVWFQFAILTASFIALAVYGIRASRTMRTFVTPLAYFGMVTMPIYFLLVGVDVVSSYIENSISGYLLLATLVRYWLAVPSAALATIGLNAASRQALANQRIPLNTYLNWGAFGFAVYSLTQLVVNPIPTVLASTLNTDNFLAITGVPIQVVRTLAGITITVSMFAAANFLEKERQNEQKAVQKLRMEMLERQEQLGKELLRNTIRAQEEERARIARELHDEMAQTLTAFSLDLKTLENTLPNITRDPGTDMILNRLQSLSRDMSQNMVQMVYALRPPHLDELGLVTALKYMLENEFQPRSLHTRMEVTGNSTRVDPLIETVLFRIAQEALVNVLRHAQTSEADLYVEYRPGSILLKVADHGCGFDSSQAFQAPHGWGLAGMRERAESVGGRFLINSSPATGTTIQVEIPTASNNGDEHVQH